MTNNQATDWGEVTTIYDLAPVSYDYMLWRSDNMKKYSRETGGCIDNFFKCGGDVIRYPEMFRAVSDGNIL